MKRSSKIKLLGFFIGITFFLGLPSVSKTQSLTPLEELGKQIMFDKKLSKRNNQSCASCHAPETGWTGPIPGINLLGAVYFGSDRKMFGNRKPPTAAYAGESPIFYYDENDGLFVGGMFWDGRATGWITGDPLADQAMGPFLNPVEQGLSNQEEACRIVARSKYAYLYENVFGEPIDCIDYDTNDGFLHAYKNFARAIAAFERSGEVSPYDSKFDYVMAGMAEFTDEEKLGWTLFNDKAMCSACHPAPEFTDFTYDNLGVPKNPANPFYEMDKVYVNGEPINSEGAEWVDPGLAGFLENLPELWFDSIGLNKSDAIADSYGKHKVPTLRNVDKRPGPGFAKSYMHNGSLKSLEEVVRFYNKRDDMIADGTVVPEVWDNMNEDELGNLGLTPEEEAAVIAFMKTLSDGYKPPKPSKK